MYVHTQENLITDEDHETLKSSYIKDIVNDVSNSRSHTNDTSRDNAIEGSPDKETRLQTTPNGTGPVATAAASSASTADDTAEGSPTHKRSRLQTTPNDTGPVATVATRMQKPSNDTGAVVATASTTTSFVVAGSQNPRIPDMSLAIWRLKPLLAGSVNVVTFTPQMQLLLNDNLEWNRHLLHKHVLT